HTGGRNLQACAPRRGPCRHTIRQAIVAATPRGEQSANSPHQPSIYTKFVRRRQPAGPRYRPSIYTKPHTTVSETGWGAKLDASQCRHQSYTHTNHEAMVP